MKRGGWQSTRPSQAGSCSGIARSFWLHRLSILEADDGRQLFPSRKPASPFFEVFGQIRQLKATGGLFGDNPSAKRKHRAAFSRKYFASISHVHFTPVAMRSLLLTRTNRA
jgi:hypothetical protein